MRFNIEERLEHWSTGWTARNQGDSDPAPFIDYVKYFVDADVLEIGPGEGRAYEVVRRIVKSYSIADISEEVLKAPVWNGIDKQLLRGYNVHFAVDFDVVHFWYVLHHIPRCELYDFLEWVRCQLRRGGMLMFNTPYLGFHEGAYADNGVLTTPYTAHDIIELIEPYFNLHYLDGTKVGRSNGLIYVGEKI